MQANYLYVGRRSHWGFNALLAFIFLLFSFQSAFAQLDNNKGFQSIVLLRGATAQLRQT